MSKIPVLGTVSRAYGFLLGEIGTIVRLAWAPLLIGSALGFVFGSEPMDAALRSNGDPNVALQYAPTQFLVGVIAFVTGVMATVALLRVVVFGDRKPGLFVNLWLGAAEFRLIIVSLLLLVAFIAGGIGVVLVFGLLAALTAAIPVLGIALLAGMVALIFAAIWVPLRLALISPVVVAENTLGVERSWALMKGNALRMFFVLLLTFLPYFIVTWIAFTALMGSDFPSFPAFPSFADIDPQKSEAVKTASEAFGKAMEQWELDLTKAIRKHWTEVAVLGFLSNLVSTALWAGVAGTAYTAVASERHE